MRDSTIQEASNMQLSDRFKDWSGELNCGFTGLDCRVFVRGKYNLGMRCGGKRLERQVACDFNPTLFTIHVVDATGDGGEWIDLTGSFAAPRTVEEVVVVDGDQHFRFAIDRTMVGDGDAHGVASSSGSSDVGEAALGGSEDEEKVGSIPCPFANTGDWSAWVNTMPGAPRKLIVTGTVEVGSDGYEGRLTPGPIGKSNPPVQYFELVLIEEAGANAGRQDVRGETLATYDEYMAVIVDCHGESVANIPVQIVS